MLRLHSRVALDSPGMLDEQDEKNEQDEQAEGDVVLQVCSDEQWRQSKCYWNTWGGWTKYWEVLKTIGSDISLQPCLFLNTQINIILNSWRLQQCWGIFCNLSKFWFQMSVHLALILTWYLVTGSSLSRMKSNSFLNGAVLLKLRKYQINF